MSEDPRVEAYIADAAPFAQPILRRLRKVVHATCPDAVETMKWSRPFFDYRGQPLCMMAAFKAHAGFGVWRRSAAGAGGEAGAAGEEANPFGEFGKLTSIADLPGEAAIAEHIRKAMALVDAGAKTARKPSAAKPDAQAPDDLLAALAANAKAQATFDAFPPGKRREYVEWVVEAKRAETREKRVAQAVEWMAEGKSRNWKYQV